MASINIWLIVVFISTLTYLDTFTTYSTEQFLTQSTLPFLTSETDRFRYHSQSTLPFLTSETDRFTKPLTLVCPNIRQAPTDSSPYQSPNMTTPAQHTLSVTLLTEPRIHLKAWLTAVHKYARSLAPTLDAYGALYLVCSDAAWQALKHNKIPDPDPLLPLSTRSRPVFPPPSTTKIG